MANIGETARVYDKGAAEYARRYTSVSESAIPFSSALNPNSRILEIGCGPGFDAGFFARQGHIVVATDIAPDMLVVAKRTNPHPQIVYREADMRSLPFGSEQFDGIFAESCLLHIPGEDALGVFRGFNRVLRPGGVLALGLQEGESQEGYRPAPFPPYDDVFVKVFSEAESRRLLTEAGFTIFRTYAKQPKEGQHPFAKRKILARKET